MTNETTTELPEPPLSDWSQAQLLTMMNELAKELEAAVPECATRGRAGAGTMASVALSAVARIVARPLLHQIDSLASAMPDPLRRGPRVWSEPPLVLVNSPPCKNISDENLRPLTPEMRELP